MFFVQTRENLMQGLLIFLKNMLKKCILAIVSRNRLNIFENSPAPGAEPLRGKRPDAQTCSPHPNQNPGYAYDLSQ